MTRMGGGPITYRAAALAAALALTACGGAADDPTTAAGQPSASALASDGPTDEPTSQPTPEPTETQDPWRFGPPGVTMNMRYDTEEGAQEFVEYYVATSNHTVRTDPDEINAQLAPSGQRLAPPDWCAAGTNLPSGGYCTFIVDGTL